MNLPLGQGRSLEAGYFDSILVPLTLVDNARRRDCYCREYHTAEIDYQSAYPTWNDVKINEGCEAFEVRVDDCVMPYGILSEIADRRGLRHVSSGERSGEGAIAVAL